MIDGFIQSLEEEKEKRKEKVPPGSAHSSRGRGGKVRRALVTCLYALKGKHSRARKGGVRSPSEHLTS